MYKELHPKEFVNALLQEMGVTVSHVLHFTTALFHSEFNIYTILKDIIQPTDNKGH